MESNSSGVAAAVWNWRQPPVKAGGESHRGRAVIEAAVMAAVGALFFWKFHKVWLAAVIWSLAGIVLIGGLFIPPLYRGFKKAGAMLAKGVGLGLSYVLLVPFFYICFPFGRLMFSLSGKDPMNRRFIADMKSYWTPHVQVADAARYTRQY